MGEKEFYERHLPHYHPESAVLFITFRLAGSLPREVLEQLKESHMFLRGQEAIGAQKKQSKKGRYSLASGFWKLDAMLEKYSTGPQWLEHPSVAEVVREAVLFRDGSVYDLLAFCIMPNHVHMLIQPLGRSRPLFRILQSLKRHTARQANKILHRTGPFWQNESYDHVVRENELERILSYVLENSVKAGLVPSWEQWHWTYVKADLL